MWKLGPNRSKRLLIQVRRQRRDFASDSANADLLGSSDTWLAGKGFQCVNVTTEADEPESDCLFASTYSIEPPFKQIPDANFNITYGDGEFLRGIFGFEPVTIAGITVQNQQVAVVDFAAWFGDGVSSGLIGVVFPSIWTPTVRKQFFEVKHVVCLAQIPGTLQGSGFSALCNRYRASNP